MPVPPHPRPGILLWLEWGSPAPLSSSLVLGPQSNIIFLGMFQPSNWLCFPKIKLINYCCS